MGAVIPNKSCHINSHTNALSFENAANIILNNTIQAPEMILNLNAAGSISDATVLVKGLNKFTKCRCD